MSWFIYVIECSDKKLYTGITTDIQRRLQEHNGGYGCSFTRGRIPVQLLHYEEFDTKVAAMRREREIKGFNRTKKLAIIAGSPSACRPQG